MIMNTDKLSLLFYTAYFINGASLNEILIEDKANLCPFLF